MAFLPLIVFLVCYVGCGITFTLLGADEPFGKFPRHVALLAGCAVALLLNRGMGVQDKLNIMTTNMGNSGVMMIVLIYLMSGILSAAMVNNTIAIIVTCPIAKEIGEKYKIAPKRLASLVDIFACAFIALMPHDGGMLMITALADVSPLNVLKYSFYMFGLIIATCVTIQFGLMDKKN